MAQVEEIITEVQVKTDSTTVKDLRDNIKALKAELEQATVGTEEFADKQQQLDEANRTLKQALSGSTASLEEMQKASRGASESYDSLVNKMADLRKEWRATTDEAKRADLGKQINEINQQLKDLDASRGVFSRNVGDYANQMKSGFADLKESIRGVQVALKDGAGLKESIKEVQAAVQGVAGSIDSYANQMAKGFQATAGAAGSVINPVKGVTAGFQAMSATPVIAIIGIIVNLLDKLIKSLKSNEETMNAFRQAMAPLNALGTSFTKWVQAAGEQLVKFVEKTVKAVTAVARFFKLIKKEDEQLMEEHKAITAEEIALTKQQRETELENAKSAERISELKAKAAEKDKYTANERLAFLNKAADEEKAIADRNLALAEKERDVLKRKAELAGNSAEENEALNKAEIKLLQTRTDHNNKMKELNAQRAEAVNQAKAENDALINLDNTLRDIIGDLEVVGDEFEKVNDKIEFEDDDWDRRAEFKIAAIEKEADTRRRLNAVMIGDEKERADEEYRITVETQQKKMEVLQEALANTMDPATMLELRQQIADLEVDIEVTKYARINELREQNGKKEKTAMQEWAENAQKASANYVAIANATASFLDTIADGMEVTNKKDFERQKKLQVASATINMITGAIGAFLQASASYPPPYGQIIGGITSATVIASGVAQINKIKSQSYESPSAGGVSAPSAAVNPPQIDTSMPVVRTITSASEEDRLNQMASPVRAYIVDSELQAKETERDRIDSETTF